MRIQYIFYCCLAMLSLQACIKIDKDVQNICLPEPVKPILEGEGTVVTQPINTYFEVPVLNTQYSSAYSYHFYGPDGEEYSPSSFYDGIYFLINSTAQAGRYGVTYGSESGVCVSDTAFITLAVSVPEPACGLSSNQFVMSYNSSNPLQTANKPTAVDNTEYYSVSFTGTGSTAITINFGSKPSSTTTTYYDVKNKAGYNLGDGEASLNSKRSSNISYNGLEGFLVTIPQPDGSMRVKMCDVENYNSSYGYMYLDANLLYNP